MPPTEGGSPGEEAGCPSQAKNGYGSKRERDPLGLWCGWRVGRVRASAHVGRSEPCASTRSSGDTWALSSSCPGLGQRARGGEHVCVHTCVTDGG